MTPITNKTATNRPRCHAATLLAGSLVLAACAATTTPAEPISVTNAVVRPHAAHQLLIDSAACWFGGMWGDIEAEANREAATEDRCKLVITTVYGHDDGARYLQLRALQPETLGDVKTAIVKMARADHFDAPNVGALANIFDALAAADRETMLARRATRRIERDANVLEKLSLEEAAALPALQSATAFDALHRVDAGSLRGEADALTMLVLLNRMRVAEEVPLHLKVYAVAEPLRETFSVPVFELPQDASRPLGPGEWLTYLVQAAAQMRHAIPVREMTPRERHENAMAGILEGIADQLRIDARTIAEDTSLARFVPHAIRALEQSRERAPL